MFREMRRAEKLIDREESMDILKKGSYGVMGLYGLEGYPYCVPVNYSIMENKIIVHGAISGHKTEAVKNNEKVSFTVVSKEEIIEKKFTAAYESVMAFGRARILCDEEEKKAALFTLIEKYSPNYLEGGRKYIDAAFGKTALIEIEIEHLTGKRNEG